MPSQPRQMHAAPCVLLLPRLSACRCFAAKLLSHFCCSSLLPPQPSPSGTHVLQVGQAHLHHATLQPVRGNLQAGKERQACNPVSMHAEWGLCQRRRHGPALNTSADVGMRTHATTTPLPHCRRLTHCKQARARGQVRAAVSGAGRTLVPWVRVTSVLPTLRVLNMLGALMSYLQQASRTTQQNMSWAGWAP